MEIELNDRKAEIIIKDDLKETNFGDFENKNYDQLKDDLNYQRWLASGGTFNIPNGERREEFITRCQKCSVGQIVKAGHRKVSLVLCRVTLKSHLPKPFSFHD